MAAGVAGNAAAHQHRQDRVPGVGAVDLRVLRCLSGGWLSDRLVKRGTGQIASRRRPLILGLIASAAFTGLAANA